MPAEWADFLKKTPVSRPVGANLGHALTILVPETPGEPVCDSCELTELSSVQGLQSMRRIPTIPP